MRPVSWNEKTIVPDFSNDGAGQREQFLEELATVCTRQRRSGYSQSLKLTPGQKQLLLLSSPASLLKIGNVSAGQMESQAPPMSFAELSPEAIIELCVHGDVAAWEEFMSRYHRLIAGVVFRTTQKWGEASPLTIDDLIQDTYLKLCADDYRLLRAYDPKHPDAIYGYLKIITANVVHDRFKALRSEKRGGDQIAEDLTTLENRSDAGKAFGSQDAMEREILLREIDRLLNTSASGNTADRDRTIFWLYYRQGLTTKAIATLPAIGLTIKGVESTLGRMTKMVRRRMVETRLANPER